MDSQNEVSVCIVKRAKETDPLGRRFLARSKNFHGPTAIADARAYIAKRTECAKRERTASISLTIRTYEKVHFPL